MASKVFLALASAVIALSGCAGSRALERAQSASIESAQRAGDAALVWRQRFIDCVSTYAKESARNASFANELANAAIASCRTPLDAFTSSQSSYRALLTASDSRSVSQWSAARDEASYLAIIDREELLQEAREVTAKVFLEAR